MKHTLLLTAVLVGAYQSHAQTVKPDSTQEQGIFKREPLLYNLLGRLRTEQNPTFKPFYENKFALTQTQKVYNMPIAKHDKNATVPMPIMHPEPNTQFHLRVADPKQ